METQTDSNNNNNNKDTISTIKSLRTQLETRIETQHNTQLDLLASLQSLVPNIVSSLDLSLQLLSSFNKKPFTPTPPLPTPITKKPEKHDPKPAPTTVPNLSPLRRKDDEKFVIDESGGPLSVVRAMVAVCLLQRVPFTAIDSSTVLRKLENDSTVTSAEKAALRELGGESGAILAVELALRSMAEDNGGVELEEFVITGKSRVMVLGIDRTRLVKELPETAEFLQQHEHEHEMVLNKNNSNGTNQSQQELNGGVYREMWMGGDSHMMMMGRGRGMGRGMGVMHGGRPTNVGMQLKVRTEEDDLKDLEAMLNKKSFMEMQKSKTGEELLDLIHRPTARETAMAARVIGISV